MIHVMVGEKPSNGMERRVRDLGWGHMHTDKPPVPYMGEKWGFDNGAFVCWKQGRPFDRELFLSRLDAALACGSDPYVAVTPDIVGAGLHSLNYSLGWLAELPKSWPWYLAVQDGMEVADVGEVVHLFSGLFLGGTTAFKGTSGRWGRLAHTAGKRFHYGRCSSPQKLVNAVRAGADSCDTNQVLWHVEKFKAFAAKWKNLAAQSEVEFA